MTCRMASRIGISKWSTRARRQSHTAMLIAAARLTPRSPYQSAAWSIMPIHSAHVLISSGSPASPKTPTANAIVGTMYFLIPRCSHRARRPSSYRYNSPKKLVVRQSTPLEMLVPCLAPRGAARGRYPAHPTRSVPSARCAGAGLGRFDRRSPVCPVAESGKPASWRRFVICLPRSKTLHDPEPAKPRRIGEALIGDLRTGVRPLRIGAPPPHPAGGPETPRDCPVGAAGLREGAPPTAAAGPSARRSWHPLERE